MDGLTIAVFGLVYLGMVVGGFPGLALDRTGIARIVEYKLTTDEKDLLDKSVANIRPSIEYVLEKTS